MSDQPGLPDSSPIRLTHLDDAGAARMVDVTAKPPTVRTADATAFVVCSSSIVACSTTTRAKRRSRRPMTRAASRAKVRKARSVTSAMP